MPPKEARRVRNSGQIKLPTQADTAALRDARLPPGEGEELLNRILDPLLPHLEPCCLVALRRVCKSMRTQVDASIRHLTALCPTLLLKHIRAAGRRWPHVESLVMPLCMTPTPDARVAAACHRPGGSCGGLHHAPAC